MIPRGARHAVLGVLLAAVASADTGQDRALARRFFAEARAVSDADGGRLWGQSLYGPILLVDPVERRLYANQAAADGDAGLEARDGVFVGSLPPRGVLAVNSAQEWAGTRWTTVTWQSIPRGTPRRKALWAHEMFHRIQPELAASGASPACAHLDEGPGRFWLRLELRALSAALLKSGSARKAAARDALVFRAARHARFEGAAEDERQLELNEGLAQYTGVRLSSIPNESIAAWVARRICDDESHEGSDPIWAVRRLEGDWAPVSFTRTFPYLTGPAYAVLLDELAPAWRATIGPDFDLSAGVGARLEFVRPADLEFEARRRGATYESWVVEADEAQRRRAMEEQRADYRRRLVDGPRVSLPLRGRRDLMVKPHEITTLDKDLRVYRTLEAQAIWGKLEVSAGGVLAHLHPNGVPRELVVPGPASPAPGRQVWAGNGWVLQLVDGWSLGPGEREGDLLLVETTPRDDHGQGTGRSHRP